MSLSGKDVAIYRMVMDLFPGKDRWLLIGVLGISLVAAFFETVGVASILPFMTLALDPTVLNRSATVQSVMHALSVTTPQGGLVVMGLMIAGVIALGNIASAAQTYVEQRFAAYTEVRLASVLFSGYLNEPYQFHVQRDAPSLLKVLNIDTGETTQAVILPLTHGVSKLAMAVGVIALLIWRAPLVALIVVGMLGLSYGLIYQLFHKSQESLGIRATNAYEEKARVSQEGIAGVKELQILGRVSRAGEEFAAVTDRAARARAHVQTLGLIPRNVMETVGFGGILVISMILVSRGGNAQTLIPVLALYAFAGYRLMPALQQVFFSAISVRFYAAPLRNLHSDFVRVTQSRKTASPVDDGPPITLRDSLRLENVSFTYSEAAGPALHNISLTIHPFQSVGLVGPSGSGKTTLADIILGVYEPGCGSVTVDGVALTRPSIRSWQKRVGYVPQSVFLANATVAENIAFGMSRSAIDMAAVKNAARMAQTEEFLLQLPKGYETVVGERGVRLSGGQRQRIGIARALYHQPDVLVFDEATSALDGLTEDAVMDAIRSLSGGRTIILIAHRLRTVEACNRIVMLDHGRIVAEGPYTGLLETSERFRRFVEGK
jgi:ABC-type multidrug transport system fused ATPase/permease subunit